MVSETAALFELGSILGDMNNMKGLRLKLYMENKNKIPKLVIETFRALSIRVGAFFDALRFVSAYFFPISHRSNILILVLCGMWFL